MPSSQTLLIAANIIYLGLLALTIYLTRASRRRTVGAMVGGLAVAVVGVGVETLAHTLGWWRYPGIVTPYGPLLLYPAVIFIFALIALVGWRIDRRFGWRGLAIFLAFLTIIATIRDYRVAAQLPEFFVFKPGINIVIVDATCWLFLSVLSLIAMRVTAGPAKNDLLSRGRKGSLT